MVHQLRMRVGDAWRGAQSPGRPGGMVGSTARSRLGRIAWGVLGACALTLLTAWAAWMLTGGQLYVVTTPSMSPHQPVGALLAARPLSAPPHVGELIAFTPPGRSSVFAHRVVQVLPGEEYRTKGALNSTPDPWTLTRADIRGEVVATFPALGRALQSLPLWAGITLLYLLLRLFLPSFIPELQIVAVAAAVVAPLLLYHPLVSGQVVSSLASNGLLHVYVVSTGILNTFAHLGGTTFLPAGHTAVLTAPAPTQGSVAVSLTAALSWWEWLLLTLVCLSPMLLAWRHFSRMQVGTVTPSGAATAAGTPPATESEAARPTRSDAARNQVVSRRRRAPGRKRSPPCEAQRRSPRSRSAR